MLTKNGVELDLEKSKYQYKYKGLVFYFSSEFNHKRFKDRFNYFVYVESTKIINRFKVNADFTLYFAIVFYKHIEKRGFYVTYNGKNIDKMNISIDIF